MNEEYEIKCPCGFMTEVGWGWVGRVWDCPKCGRKLRLTSMGIAQIPAGELGDARAEVAAAGETLVLVRRIDGLWRDPVFRS